MKSTITLLFILISWAGFSQVGVGSIKFFADGGEKFTVYIDGEVKNSAPASTVKVDNIATASVRVKIVFEDNSIEPIVKTMMRWGTDQTVMIKKNKKGGYDTKVMNPTGGGSANDGPPVMQAAPTSEGPLTASYANGSISLSDGRHFTVRRDQTHGMGMNPTVEVKAPAGATVHFSYDANKEEFKGEVPFVYSIQDYNCNNAYFKMEVTETNGAHWSVKMQNGTGYKLTIE